MTDPDMPTDPLKPLRGQEPFETDNGRVRSTVRDWHIAIAVHPSWAPVLAAALNRALSADEQIARLQARGAVLEALHTRCLECYGDLPRSIQRLLRDPTREELLALAEAIREADRPEPNATDESLFTRQAAPGGEGGQRE